MKLTEFRDSLLDQLRFESAANLTSDVEALLAYVSDALIEAEELDDEITYLPFEGIGSSRRKIQIDGYSYNELDEYLSLYVVAPLTYDELSTLTVANATTWFNRARAFIQDAAYIERTAEESAPAYGLAIDIGKRYRSVRKYCIYLITDMTISRNLRQFKMEPVRGIPVEPRIIDITYLYQLEESKTGKEDLVIDLLEYTDHGLPCLTASQTEDYTAYLCNIPGMVLAQLYNTYGGRLLEGNVRSFLQTRGKVNKGIRNTILNAPDMFFAYNNGIAATAYSIKTDSREGGLFITEMTALQIVNGGQTTASLASALLKDKRDGSEDSIRKIYVPMKLSIVSPEKAQELIPNISRYANSQNKVSEADLWSNHPFHIRMETISRRLLAPATAGNQYGTHWYYERANGQYKQETYKLTDAQKRHFALQNPKAQMFTKTDLAKYMNIKMCKPHIASTGGQKSFARFAEWAAVQWEKSEDEFNDKFFREVVAMAILFKQADKIVKAQPWYNSYKANIVAYTLSKIIYTVQTEYLEMAIDYRSIWMRQGLSDAWVQQIEVMSKVMYEMLVDDKRLVENVTEWAKREACWEQAKKLNVELLPVFIKELIYKDEDRQESKDEKASQRLTSKVNAMVEVANYGVENWRFLLDWDSTRKVLTPRDISFVNVALSMARGKFPSEKQCAVILDVLEKARSEGFPK